MTDFISTPIRAGGKTSRAGSENVHVRRGNELALSDCARRRTRTLAEILRADFDAELMLMVANDRRADKGVFEVHYLFANDRENWFVHATDDLPARRPDDSFAGDLLSTRPRASSVKSMICSASKPSATPIRRPLVRHAFWPEDYFPLRKDPARRRSSTMMARRFPF